MEPVGQRGEARSHPAVGHELTDFKSRNIGFVAVVLSITIVLVFLVSRWLFEFATVLQAEKQHPPSPLASTREPAPGPRLQVHASKDLEEMRAGENTLLNGYGWIDQ